MEKGLSRIFSTGDQVSIRIFGTQDKTGSVAFVAYRRRLQRAIVVPPGLSMRERSTMFHYTLQRSGKIAQKTGYVTQLKSIVAKNTWQLERSLGFGPFSLSAGYQLYFLFDYIHINEFQWKDTTRYSAGWASDANAVVVGKNGEVEHFYAQRFDQLRYERDAANQRNIAQRPNLPDDWEIDQFMRRQVPIINIQRGPQRIVKVVPNKPFGAVTYPDASEKDIQQWELIVPKNFVLAADIEPGEVVQRGMFDACCPVLAPCRAGTPP